MSGDPDPADDETASSPVSTAPSPEPEPAALEPDTVDDLAALNDSPDEPEPEPELTDPSPGDADGGATIERLQEQVDELTGDVEAANRRAEEMTTFARRQSEMVEELHRDNRTLRKGEMREAIAPLIRGVARLSDDLTRMQTGEDEPSADLTFLQARVAELLHDCGILEERPEPGAIFDPHVHEAAGSATTGDASADRTIAELRRSGLRRDDGSILRPAHVVVHRYVAPASPPPAEPDCADEPEPETVDSVETDTTEEEDA